MTIEFDGIQQERNGVTFGARCITCEDQVKADPNLSIGEISRFSTILPLGRNGIRQVAIDDAKEHEKEFSRKHRIVVAGALFRADEPYPGGYFIDRP